MASYFIRCFSYSGNFVRSLVVTQIHIQSTGFLKTFDGQFSDPGAPGRDQTREPCGAAARRPVTRQAIASTTRLVERE